MDLALPLHGGRPLASVLHPERKGLREQLIRGFWLTQARGREGYGIRGKSVVAEASVKLQQPEAHHVFSQGELSLDHRTLAVAGCTGSQEGRCD